MQWSFIANNKSQDPLVSSSPNTISSVLFYGPKSAASALQHHLCTFLPAVYSISSVHVHTYILFTQYSSR